MQLNGNTKVMSLPSTIETFDLSKQESSIPWNTLHRLSSNNKHNH